jgi:hypothetical protein
MSRGPRSDGHVPLAHELRDDDVFIVVLGGLVPEVLAGDDAQIPDHLGTTDVDMLLLTHVRPNRDLGAVERALGRIGFRPVPGHDGCTCCNTTMPAVRRRRRSASAAGSCQRNWQR